MGALAPGTPWIPEDDLLLKNAVEAGASLESLAKGAVQFSRRFMLRELQDRWHSLLYDPVTSAEAAERMIEFERSAPNLSSKSNRADASKETKGGPGKRKIETVRRRYYALRKKLCSEPLNQGDLSFLVAPGDDCFMGGPEEPGQNMLGDPMGNHFGIEEANFNDLHHVFPQVIGNSAPPCGAGEFHLGQQDTLEVPIDQNDVHRNAPPILGNNNMGMDENYARMGQMDMPKELPGSNIFDANALEASTACNSKDIMCTDFGGNAIFNSPMSDCDTAFHHLQYTSTPPAMPDWRPIEDISVPEMPVDVSSGGNNVQTGDAFRISGDGDGAKGTSECVEPESNDQISCSGLRNSTGCTDGYFVELSASLLNFSDEEMLIGRKDAIDKTYFDGLSSLLLNSPDDVNEDKMPNMPETKAAIQGACPDIVRDKGPNDPSNSGNTPVRDGSVQCDTETQTSSSTVNNPPFPEFHDGVIFCALNTEDPEIPCNDDVVFPSKPRLASAHKRTQNEANNPALAGKDNTNNLTNDKGSGTMKREPKRFGESHSAACETRGPDIGKKHAVDEFGVKCEASKGESLNGRNPNSSYPGPCQTSLAIKNESSELTSIGQPGCSNTDKPGHVSELGHPQIGTGGITQDGQTLSTTRNHDCHVLGPADSMVPEPGGDSLMSDPEEQFSESDTDIPYYSDIESMILDMDLGPDDQDSFSLTKVAKYQNDDAKRTIIRLEQTAHSYMQRAIASHGAFAILYGRHSKHYIKKPEVLLGRGTDDIVVDIDLGREGRANKVSRRQAIIKMDKDGSFTLKNLGRCTIYVNSKEVLSGLWHSLHSNCLIEIRGLPFIFETNQACVKQYLDNAAVKLEGNCING